MMTRNELASYIDHTLLKPEATPDEALAVIEEAQILGVKAVCLSPSMLSALRPLPDLGKLKLAAVCGFPSGKHSIEIKTAEAHAAVAAGADEIDMVIDIGRLKAGHSTYIHQEIAGVKKACGTAIVKVIIESAALTDGEIVAACQIAEAAGADFVKTSTGFHPAGGATIHAVQLMRVSVSRRVSVKASGGIRDAQTALAMIEAGADRLGLSASQSILAELDR